MLRNVRLTGVLLLDELGHAVFSLLEGHQNLQAHWLAHGAEALGEEFEQLGREALGHGRKGKRKNEA